MPQVPSRGGKEPKSRMVGFELSMWIKVVPDSEALTCIDPATDNTTSFGESTNSKKKNYLEIQTRKKPKKNINK